MLATTTSVSTYPQSPYETSARSSGRPGQKDARTSAGTSTSANNNSSSSSSSSAPTDYFPQLSKYSDPETGLLSKLPSSWIPYGQLMRIDRPGGLYAFYFPYLIGTAYAACIAKPTPDLSTVLWQGAMFLPFNIVLRGTACAWNDTVDAKFDRQVERTRHRPVARGAVSTTQGYVFTAALGLLVMAMAAPSVGLMPTGCLPHVALSTVMFYVYALLKRVTHYPQVFLGFPFAWAIFISLEAMGTDALAGWHVWPTMALFGANILWTVTYDTIYAHQDLADDERAGVKGMAVRFANSTKLLGSLLSAGQVALLALCGAWAGFGPAYFAGTVGGVALAMAYYIYDVDLKKPESCGAWFHDQFLIVGAGFMAGLVAEYGLKVTGTELQL